MLQIPQSVFSSVSSLLFQVDVTKCVVNTDPSFHSHWLVSAACAFGHYVKATVLYLLREKWETVPHWMKHSEQHSEQHCPPAALLWIMFTLICTEPSWMNTQAFMRTLLFFLHCIFIVNGYVMAHVWFECINDTMFLALNFPCTFYAVVWIPLVVETVTTVNRWHLVVSLLT